MYDHVSQRVNHLRFVNHWSQKEVALRLGMTPTSLYPDGARAYGLPFDMLMEALVRSGLDRGKRG